MTRRLLLFLLPLLACAPAPPPPAVVPAAPPQLSATGTAQRVVFVSFDALGADSLAQQNVPAFTALARDGAAARIIPINPTLTGPAHATMLTGAEAQVHGIVANRFHAPGTPPERTARGMEMDPDVETIIQAARRQGKRVGAVPFPGVYASSPRYATDFGMNWPQALAPARMMKLTRADFFREWFPPTWTQTPAPRPSFSPVMRARVEWSIPNVFRADVDLVAYDTTDDARENYDTIVPETNEREVSRDARGWFALSAQTNEGLAGSWSKVVRVDPALANVEIYWGAITRTSAWPSSFQQSLDGEVGFWPGVPEEAIDVERELFLEQAERLADFLTRAQTFAIRTMPFDLLLAYQPEIDEVSHSYLDEDSVRRAFAAADRALGAIRGSLDLTRDALVVTGDHGMHAVDTELRVNSLLSEHGLFPRWRAFASAHIAHLYRSGGEEDSDAVVNLLTNTGLFEIVEKKHANSHRNTGDVIATAKPNVLLSSSSEAPATRTPALAGTHGTLNTHRAMHTVLFATGAGAPSGSLGEVSQTRIARFLSQLLGITPPAAAE
jgi:Type I phosphodiesterase / nucleotide pyrophosphatase